MTSPMLTSLSDALELFTLREGYLSGLLSPKQVVHESLARIRSRTSAREWTFLVNENDLLARAEFLEGQDRSLAFYGIPFSVKDNINVQGLPTTAGCQAYRFYPKETSPVVQAILDGGGILMGKNTMDTFATGVVGVRSEPHPVNPFHSDYIPGGSSSGSAVVVSKRCVTFSLGSDTGGSGRVPAALCNVVGFKPSPDALCKQGMVYANKSIDCIPIFCSNTREAEYVFSAILKRSLTDTDALDSGLSGLKVAIPNAQGLRFFGDQQAQCAFEEVITQLKSVGCKIEPIDFSVFSNAGNLLFEGGYLSERFHSVGEFIKQNRSQVDEVAGSIILSGEAIPPSVIWCDLQAVQAYTKAAHQCLQNYDFLLTPTAGTIYRVEEVKANPIEFNKNMAYYTNFGNLLNLSVISMPARIREDGLPFGISLITINNKDLRLLKMARSWEEISGITPGCTNLD